MYLTNAAHEHFTTQTGKKSKAAPKNFMGRGAEGPRAEKNKYPNFCLILTTKFHCFLYFIKSSTNLILFALFFNLKRFLIAFLKILLI